MYKGFLGLLMIAGLFQSCVKFEYSPNQAFSGDSKRDINEKNILRLQQSHGDDTVRFVLTGDSQRAYKSAEDLVEAVNKLKGIDFVLLAGDISDFGLSQEMEWVDKIFSKLNAPYMGVIGNHDLVANGKKAFERMFGPLNFTFTYQGIKFVCHDTNSREYSFSGNIPDVDWLKQALQPEQHVNAYITVAHVPPNDGDFDTVLEAQYVATINGSPNTLAALYAHQHRSKLFYPGNQDSIPYIVTDAIQHRQFKLIEVVNGKIKFEDVAY